MKAGDIALAQLQQADGQQKVRPVLLLKQFPPFGDWLVCGISSQLRHTVSDFDKIIRESDDDFSKSGIHVSSIIRLGHIATLAKKDLAGTMGRIRKERCQRILTKLATFLKDD